MLFFETALNYAEKCPNFFGIICGMNENVFMITKLLFFTSFCGIIFFPSIRVSFMSLLSLGKNTSRRFSKTESQDRLLNQVIAALRVKAFLSSLLLSEKIASLKRLGCMFGVSRIHETRQLQNISVYKSEVSQTLIVFTLGKFSEIWKAG